MLALPVVHFQPPLWMTADMNDKFVAKLAKLCAFS